MPNVTAKNEAWKTEQDVQVAAPIKVQVVTPVKVQVATPVIEIDYGITPTYPEDETVFDREQLLESKVLYRIGRRAQDIFFSLVALIAFLPLILITAIAIKLDDPNGGVFFAQDRVGRDGKVFKCYKLRSMVSNAEECLSDILQCNEMDGPAFKIKDDPRITKVGKFIRKSSIDELPQFWNVLRGEMSLVGPRPALPREVALYNDYQKQRLFVKPGLTCYWQVQPNRNEISFDEWMNLDMRYIQNRSFLTDWIILLKTVAAVFTAQGE